jgi:hypothetical protein
MRLHTPCGSRLIASLRQSPLALSQDFPESLKRVNTPALASQLSVGDVVFIHVRVLPFLKVAQTTLSWTNHVGIVVETQGREPRIAESAFPISKTTSLSRFIARSAQGRVTVRRLLNPLSTQHQSAIRRAAQRRLGIVYDTGFNLHSRRQFCSRFVREVLIEATGNVVGEIERFSDFLARNPDVDLRFWQLWYFGRIPWRRQTVTPASLLNCSKMQTIFDGYAEQKGNMPSWLHRHCGGEP